MHFNSLKYWDEFTARQCAVSVMCVCFHRSILLCVLLRIRQRREHRQELWWREPVVRCEISLDHEFRWVGTEEAPAPKAIFSRNGYIYVYKYPWNHQDLNLAKMMRHLKGDTFSKRLFLVSKWNFRGCSYHESKTKQRTWKVLIEIQYMVPTFLAVSRFF